MKKLIYSLYFLIFAFMASNVFLALYEDFADTDLKELRDISNSSIFLISIIFYVITKLKKEKLKRPKLFMVVVFGMILSAFEYFYFAEYTHRLIYHNVSLLNLCWLFNTDQVVVKFFKRIFRIKKKAKTVSL